MRCSFYAEKNTERKICTSECMREVHINMTQKMKNLCSPAQSQATRKVTSSDRSRLINRQGKCTRILVTHQLKTTSGSYREITVNDIDVAHNIWGNSVPTLKVNTTRKKPIPVAGDLV